MEKILVTGANGLLGQHLIKWLLKEDFFVVATGRGESRLSYHDQQKLVWYDADIADDWRVQQIMEKEQPGIVVHAAAVTQIDECQLNHENCEAVNVRATAQLLLSAGPCCKHFIYVSTDFVFDGEKGDYVETDDLNPVSWYGFTKVQAEALVETSELPFCIVRTCLVYGRTLSGTRSNIIEWVKKSLEHGTPIKVVTDQWRTPTYVEDLAEGILLIIRSKTTGIYHIAGKDTLTPYEIAVQTAAACGLNGLLIEPTDEAHFVQPARRPPRTGLNISKARSDLGYEPLTFSAALQHMFADRSSPA